MTDTPKKQGLLSEFSAPDPAEWRALVEETLNGVPFEKKLVTRTPEGIAVQPIYYAEDVAALAPAQGLPGQAPFLRGTDPLGYKQCAWELSQVLPYPSAEAFNAAAREDLPRGLEGVILTLDLVSRCGEDAATAPVGRVGVGGTSLQTIEDLARALEGIDLTRTALHLDAGVSGAVLLEWLKELRGSLAGAQGSLGLDPLGHLAAHGQLPAGLDTFYDEMADAVKLLEAEGAQMQAVAVDAGVYGRSGGSAVLELAAVLATGAEYLRALIDRGIAPSTAAASIRLVVGVGADFFMEIAKFRTLRALWAQMTAAFGAEGDAVKARVHASVNTWNKTVYDPYVNLLRTATECFSAALGGVDGMSSAPFDVTLGLPNSFSRRVARNQQLVLRHEAHLTEVIDPAGGSWYIESLCHQLGEKAWALFQELEAKGGMAAALKAGVVQDLAAAAADERGKILAQRRGVLVGTNMYANVEETLPEVEQVDGAALQRAQRQAVADSRQPSLAQRIAARYPGGGLTVAPLRQGRLAAGYEALRRRARLMAETTGQPPTAFLANMGPARQHKVRSDFTAEFLRPSGMRILADQSFDGAEAAAQAAVDSGAQLTVLCSTDDTYPELVPPFARAVKALKPGMMVLVAGLLPEHVADFKAAGVDEFIHIKANNLALLQMIFDQAGVQA